MLAHHATIVQNEPVKVTILSGRRGRFLLEFPCHLNLLNMTDQELYEKARLYGQNALLWRQKFTGLLPEVNRRRLHERHGFGSIFEFAYKLAGLSEQQVRTALNLGERFANKPTLKALLENGEVSINKLVRVQSIATTKNEVELAQAVRVLPKSALETLVRDERALPGQRIPLQLSGSVQARLTELQSKGIDLDALLTEFLDQREEKIAQEKEAIAENLPAAKSHYVPARTKRVVRAENGTKCSIPTCYRPAEELHHTQRFSLARTHDPHYLAPLCKAHHQIAHAIEQKVQTHRQAAIDALPSGS